MLADVPGWLQALVLGVVQGLTEFIPVSSSGHLVVVPALAGWQRHGLAFDVALHLGTLLALLVYYRADLWQMLRAVTSRTATPVRQAYRRLTLMLVVASVPVAVVGVTLDDAVEEAFATPTTAASLLFASAAVLVVGERAHRRQRVPTVVPVTDERSAAQQAQVGNTAVPDGPGLVQALAVGAAQACALLPGLSRSGLTISAGITVGLPRPAATRFAFLLGLPAIAGAALVQVPRVDDLGGVTTGELVVGVLAAAVSGYLAIFALVRLVSRTGVDRFAWYLVPAATISLLLLR